MVFYFRNKIRRLSEIGCLYWRDQPVTGVNVLINALLIKLYHFAYSRPPLSGRFKYDCKQTVTCFGRLWLLTKKLYRDSVKFQLIMAAGLCVLRVFQTFFTVILVLKTSKYQANGLRYHLNDILSAKYVLNGCCKANFKIACV